MYQEVVAEGKALLAQLWCAILYSSSRSLVAVYSDSGACKNLIIRRSFPPCGGRVKIDRATAFRLVTLYTSFYDP